MALVVDASIVACWYFPDESSAVADAAFARLRVERAVVPAIWWFEVHNLLITNERRGRTDAVETAQFLVDLEALPIEIDRTPDGGTILALARAHRLTAYDAAYLKLALRLSAPLATLDRTLARAARAAAVPLLGEGEA